MEHSLLPRFEFNVKDRQTLRWFLIVCSLIFLGFSRSAIGQSVYENFTFTTLAGPQDSGSGRLEGVTNVALFGAAAGVARDAAGNIYVADEGNSVIRKITPAGLVTTLAGLAGV